MMQRQRWRRDYVFEKFDKSVFQDWINTSESSSRDLGRLREVE